MYYYECEAWEIEADHDDLMQVDQDSSICPVFSIEIFANLVNSHQPSPTITEQLLLPQGQLRSWWSAISSKLSQMQVPFTLHATVMQKIIECARSASAANETRNKNRNNIHIIVTLCSVRLSEEETIVSDDYYEGYAFEESFDNASVFRLIRGASKRAIESLEKVQVEGNIFTVQQCVICLEEILDGLKASRMPCSHVYHQRCILTWLENSNLCPLCRFQMPN